MAGEKCVSTALTLTLIADSLFTLGTATGMAVLFGGSAGPALEDAGVSTGVGWSSPGAAFSFNPIAVGAG